MLEQEKRIRICDPINEFAKGRQKKAEKVEEILGKKRMGKAVVYIEVKRDLLGTSSREPGIRTSCMAHHPMHLEVCNQIFYDSQGTTMRNLSFERGKECLPSAHTTVHEGVRPLYLWQYQLQTFTSGCMPRTHKATGDTRQYGWGQCASQVIKNGGLPNNVETIFYLTTMQQGWASYCSETQLEQISVLLGQRSPEKCQFEMEPRLCLTCSTFP